ncbi:MAG: hypothetical protein R2688_03750 [Fimbriimonadaceae bacterium]
MTININLPENLVTTPDEHHDFRSAFRVNKPDTLKLADIAYDLIFVLGNGCSAHATPYRDPIMIGKRANVFISTSVSPLADRFRSSCSRSEPSCSIANLRSGAPAKPDSRTELKIASNEGFMTVAFANPAKPVMYRDPLRKKLIGQDPTVHTRLNSGFCEHKGKSAIPNH